MSIRFYDLEFEVLPGGAVRLTQNDCGEDTFINAHPEQINFIARQLCGLKSETAAQVADLERRISVLADGLEKLVGAEWFRSSIVERCGDGIEIMCRLDALMDLAYEFDGGRLLPETPSGDQQGGDSIRSESSNHSDSERIANKPLDLPTKNTDARTESEQQQSLI